MYLPGAGRQKPLHALGPFDGYHALLLKQLGKSDRLDVEFSSVTR